uniref:Uncharacterized protein n=1 Tax=Rhizophora mucronata TaxID=61149 RepID=A0A2P2NAS8_RHIMU
MTVLNYCNAICFLQVCVQAQAFWFDWLEINVCSILCQL